MPELEISSLVWRQKTKERRGHSTRLKPCMWKGNTHKQGLLLLPFFYYLFHLLEIFRWSMISSHVQQGWPSVLWLSIFVLDSHTEAKILNLSKNSHFGNLIFDKILILEISFLTKFTFSNSHFWQNSHFQSLIFHKKKSHFQSLSFHKNSHFAKIIFLVISG